MQTPLPPTSRDTSDAAPSAPSVSGLVGRSSGARNASRSSRWLTAAALLGLLIAIAASLLIAASLALQAGATAYIVGEGYWSKAQQDAVQLIYRYSMHGDVTTLQKARVALDVPLGDHAARLAMEQDPIDMDRAFEGLQAGRNDPRDIPSMIRMFRYLHSAPYFREAVVLWREADVHILELADILDSMEQLWATDAARSAEMAELRRQSQEKGELLQPLAIEFSRTMVEGSRWLRSLLIGVNAMAFMLMAALAVTLMSWMGRRIRDSESHFRTAFRQAGVGMAKLGPDGTFIEVNDTLCTMLDRSHLELRGLRLNDVLHPDDVDVMQEVERHVEDGAESYCALPVEIRLLREGRDSIWARATVSDIKIGGDSDAQNLLIVEDVSEARRLAQEVIYQASHDALTGLINRREIEIRLEQLLKDAREKGSNHALCFLDLDQFKIVNDTCGHSAGDELLRRLAAELPGHLRTRDAMGRLGGDEFAVLLDSTRPEGALRAAEKLQRALAAFVFRWEGRNFTLTASIGIVEIDALAPDVGWLLRAADTACYLAKEEGRNRIRVYVESDQAMARRRSEMEWVGELRRALDEDRVCVYAQRIDSTTGKSGLRFEALVRLVDAAGRLRTPAEFLPAAERYGQAMTLDRRVLELTLLELARHPESLAQLELCHINVSAQSMSDAEFRQRVADLLDASPIPGEKLCFELTETAAIADLPHARRFIESVRSRGCKVALDDFGSGLSSYGYLKQLDFDILKIDGVFVIDMLSDAVDQAVVRSIREIGNALGKQTIAEWVENDEVRQLLAEIGVDLVQGFAVHEPCPIEELLGEIDVSRTSQEAEKQP